MPTSKENIDDTTTTTTDLPSNTDQSSSVNKMVPPSNGTNLVENIQRRDNIDNSNNNNSNNNDGHTNNRNSSSKHNDDKIQIENQQEKISNDTSLIPEPITEQDKDKEKDHEQEQEEEHEHEHDKIDDDNNDNNNNDDNKEEETQQQVIAFSNHKISAFVHKLYLMLSDTNLDNVIRWSRLNENDDTTFALIPGSEFVNILTNYFKHGNVASFVRQLHMYGFHKVGNINYLHSSPNDSTKVIWEFRHSSGKFKKGDTSSLHLIKRRSNSLKQNSLHHSLINTSTNNTTNYYNTTTGITTTTNNMDEWMAQQTNPHNIQNLPENSNYIQHDVNNNYYPNQIISQSDPQQQQHQLYYQQQQQQQQPQQLQQQQLQQQQVQQQQQQQQQVQQHTQSQQQQQQQHTQSQEYFTQDYTPKQQYYVQQPSMNPPYINQQSNLPQQGQQYFSTYPHYQIVYQQPLPSEIERSNSGASISDETDVSFTSSRRSRVPSVFIDPLAPVPPNVSPAPQSQQQQQQQQQVVVTHRVVNPTNGAPPSQYASTVYEYHPSQQQNGTTVQYAYPPQPQPQPQPQPRGGSYPTLVVQQQSHLYPAPRPPRSLPNEYYPSSQVVIPTSHPTDTNGYSIPRPVTPTSQIPNYQSSSLYKSLNQSPNQQQLLQQQQQQQQQPRSSSLPSHQPSYHQTHIGHHPLHSAHHQHYSQPHIPQRSSLVNHKPNSISSISNHTKSISSSKSDSIFSNSTSVSYHPGSIVGFPNSSFSSSSTSNNSISFPPSSPSLPPSNLQSQINGSHSKLGSIISNSFSRTSLYGILNDDNEKPNSISAASMRTDSLTSNISFPTSPRLKMMSSSNSITMSRPMSPQQLANNNNNTNGETSDQYKSQISSLPVELKNPVPVNSKTSKLTSFSAYTRSSIFGHNGPKGGNRLSLVSPTSIPPTKTEPAHLPDRGSIVSPTSIPHSFNKEERFATLMSTVETLEDREKQMIKEEEREEEEEEKEKVNNGDDNNNNNDDQGVKKRKLSDMPVEEKSIPVDAPPPLETTNKQVTEMNNLPSVPASGEKVTNGPTEVVTDDKK